MHGLGVFRKQLRRQSPGGSAGRLSWRSVGRGWPRGPCLLQSQAEIAVSGGAAMPCRDPRQKRTLLSRDGHSLFSDGAHSQADRAAVSRLLGRFLDAYAWPASDPRRSAKSRGRRSHRPASRQRSADRGRPAPRLSLRLSSPGMAAPAPAR